MEHILSQPLPQPLHLRLYIHPRLEPAKAGIQAGYITCASPTASK